MVGRACIMQSDSSCWAGDEMDTLISNYLSKLEFGELQQFENIGVVPLFSSANHGPEYLTLKEAIEKKLITITEISHSGSVPELKAANKAEIPILLLDGEELAGAKQNRVLNTTILLKEDSETIIPVSCTEQNRWSYVSDEFDDSGHIMSRKLRVDKTCSVSESLNRFKEFKADQGAVWDGIDEMRVSAKAHSPTNAMKDIFESGRTTWTNA